MSIEKAPTVLITGCTDGSIGHSLALSFTRQGYHVFTTARRLSAMSSLKTMPSVTLLELDVTSPESIRTVHGAVSAATSGRLDILYNNAGIRSVTMGIDSTYKIATDTMAVNFSGIVEMVHVFSDLVIASKGKIVFTSSGAGKLPVPTAAIYNASKAALDLYAKTLRIEMQPLGVGVTNVITGQIATAMVVQPLGPLDASMLPFPANSVTILRRWTCADSGTDSPYKSIEKDLNKFWTSDRPLMDVTKYSDSVVKKVTGNNSPELIWMNSDFVWWAYFLKVTWLFPIVFAKEFGLNKLKVGKV
jgi:1-acylglycerone phosphate reductase